MTQPELVKATGMSQPTVHRAIADLRREQLIESANGEEPAGGVRLGRRAGLVVGVDVGRAHRKAVLADVHGGMIGAPVEDEREPPEECGPAVLDAIADLVVAAVREAGELARGEGRPAYALSEVRAIGVGLPFPLSPRGVTVGMFAPQLSGLDLARTLEDLLHERARALDDALYSGVKIRFAKDGDLGAMALWRDRTLRQLRGDDGGADPLEESLLYLKASHGLDAGIICHGMLVAGGRGLAGQIGHMWLPYLEDRLAYAIYGGQSPASLPQPTARCRRCGRLYCLENFASGRAILAGLSHTATNGTEAAPQTLKELVEHVSEQQIERPDIRRALIRAGSLIGVVLADATRLADPTRIVVGGLLAQAGETFMTPLQIAFAQTGLPGLEPSIVAVTPDRIDTLELEGAIALALKHVRFQWRTRIAASTAATTADF